MAGFIRGPWSESAQTLSALRCGRRMGLNEKRSGAIDRGVVVPSRV